MHCTFSLFSFRKFIQDSDDDDDDVEKDGDGKSQLLTRRIKTQEEKVRCWWQLPCCQEHLGTKGIPSMK